jgi:hypothetical protein
LAPAEARCSIQCLKTRSSVPLSNTSATGSQPILLRDSSRRPGHCLKNGSPADVKQHTVYSFARTGATEAGRRRSANPNSLSLSHIVLKETLAPENVVYAGAGGVREGNRAHEFIGRFLDTDTGIVYGSSGPAGWPASIHRLNRLPVRWIGPELSRAASHGSSVPSCRDASAVNCSTREAILQRLSTWCRSFNERGASPGRDPVPARNV